MNQLPPLGLMEVRRKMALGDWPLRLTSEEAEVLRVWFVTYYDRWRETKVACEAGRSAEGK